MFGKVCVKVRRRNNLEINRLEEWEYVCVYVCVRASERKSGQERRVFINFAHRRFAGHLAAGKGVMAAEKVW